jgi:hypothetical protein
MFKELLIQIIASVLSITVTTLLGILSFYIKKYLASKQTILEYQKQQLINKIGYENYTHDIKLAEGIIHSVEQLGKEYNWESMIKHAHATELISEKTQLSPEDIFNIIKATVGEIKVHA